VNGVALDIENQASAYTFMHVPLTNNYQLHVRTFAKPTFRSRISGLPVAYAFAAAPVNISQVTVIRSGYVIGLLETALQAPRYCSPSTK